ncbi:hypothetical protein IQ07DRAFT_646810 [Pyrenochaeta sp. DS3sAY3a]|nr:hypothetical protein IQ07DRAFT_646810 [Pyrenochaeta sp. DS3sAY3a]
MLAQPQTSHVDSEHEALFQTAPLDRHRLSDFVVDFFSHMFAPTAYVQCTTTRSYLSSPYMDRSTSDRKCTMIVDDEYILLEDDDELDGGPLCREATIASWKTKAKPVQKERRRSMQWLATVIKREFPENKTG